MPRDARPSRVPRTAWSRAVTVAVAVAALGTAGCQSIGTGSDLTSGSHLVNALATRLDRSTELTYSADYRLPGGSTGTITQAQRPRRSAFSYPGGKVTITAEATTECRTGAKAASCVLSPSPADTGPPANALVAAAGQAPTMVAPATVVAMLTATARDANALVEQHDTTVAGRHATCVVARDARQPTTTRFAACITTEGVLGSFTGTVDGQPIDVAMTGYRDVVDAQAFALPPGAKLVNTRLVNARPTTG